VSEDPVFNRDPGRQILTNPQSFNSYSYAHNNPLNLSDPSGEASIAQQIQSIYQQISLLQQILSLYRQVSAMLAPPPPGGSTAGSGSGGGTSGGGGSSTNSSSPQNTSIRVTGLTWTSQWDLPNSLQACKSACDTIIGTPSKRRDAIDTITRDDGGHLQNHTDALVRGVQTLDDFLEKNKAISVGVNRDGGLGPNDNDATQHFVVIQGRVDDGESKYYTFWDPGTRDKGLGTSEQNRLYLNPFDQSLSGTTAYSGANYVVTEIRPY